MWRYLLIFLPTLALAQVQQGRPNADFAPEFAGQTRAPALAETSVVVEVYASGLRSPWGMASLPGGQLLVTERGGTLRLVSGGQVSAPITGLPEVQGSGQGGLLDVAVSPGFVQDRLIYWTYSKPVRGGAVTAAGRSLFYRTKLWF